MPDHRSPDSTPELPLDRYLAGEATPAQSARIEAWLAGDSVRARLLAELRQAGEGPLPPIDVQAIGARIEQRIDAPETIDRTSAWRQRRLASQVGLRTWSRGWVPFALGVVVAAGIGYGYMRRVGQTATSQHAAEVTQRYTTDVRQRATITLTDGSRVTLAPQTTLTLAPGFGGESRRVAVEGEAYFVVTHSTGAPFVVRVGNAVAHVLGTAFVVRKFPDDTAARVIVTQGKVGVRSTQSANAGEVQGVLTASAMAIVSDSGRVTLTSGVPVDDYIAWTEGRLVFRDTPLREAIGEIARAYGVTIVADSTLFERHVTLTATTSKRSLHEVLDVLATIVDAHYTQKGDVVIIRPGRRTTREMPTQPQTFLEKRYGR
jgi:ferric-dicitrate binding protein FerR (iron transport regulator)